MHVADLDPNRSVEDPMLMGLVLGCYCYSEIKLKFNYEQQKERHYQDTVKTFHTAHKITSKTNSFT